MNIVHSIPIYEQPGFFKWNTSGFLRYIFVKNSAFGDILYSVLFPVLFNNILNDHGES